MVEETSTRTATDTEYTEWVEQQSFPGKVPLLTTDGEAAANIARTYINEPHEVFMWTDESKLESNQTD